MPRAVREFHFTRRTADTRPNEHAHPLVKFLYVQCLLHHLSRAEMCARAGVDRSTVGGWWAGRRRYPRLDHLEACLGVFGFNRLKPTVEEEHGQHHGTRAATDSATARPH